MMQTFFTCDGCGIRQPGRDSAVTTDVYLPPGWCELRHNLEYYHACSRDCRASLEAAGAEVLDKSRKTLVDAMREAADAERN